MLRLMMITGNPEIARFAANAGVDRIFVDMEFLGKAERQGHLDTHKASHSIDDVRRVRKALGGTELMVRLNPLYENTVAEVEAVLTNGADRLMLPMFRTPEEVLLFDSIVAGRAPVTYLVETPEAYVRLYAYLDTLREQDEIYFGLNDLAIGLGLSFLFESLAGGLFDAPAETLRRRSIPFGFGGIARMGTGELPAELVWSEHVRLGSSWVILSRAFHGGVESVDELARLNLQEEIQKLRRTESEFRQAQEKELLMNRAKLRSRVHLIAHKARTYAYGL